MSHLFDLAATVAARLVVPLLFVTSTLLIAEYVTDPPPVEEIWEATPSTSPQATSITTSTVAPAPTHSDSSPTQTAPSTSPFAPGPTQDGISTPSGMPSPTPSAFVPSILLPTLIPTPTLLPLPSPSCFLPPACGKPEKLPCLPIPLPLCP